MVKLINCSLITKRYLLRHPQIPSLLFTSRLWLISCVSCTGVQLDIKGQLTTASSFWLSKNGRKIPLFWSTTTPLSSDLSRKLFNQRILFIHYFCTVFVKNTWLCITVSAVKMNNGDYNVEKGHWTLAHNEIVATFLAAQGLSEISLKSSNFLSR